MPFGLEIQGFPMRTLLLAATTILVSTAALAQEMVPAKPATPPAVQETNDRAMPAQASTSSLIDQLKAVGELKDTKDAKTGLEAPVPRLEPVQAEAKPAETRPVEEKKIEVLPAQAKPADTPLVAQPAATKPAVTPPVAAAPAATPPVAPTTTAAKPAETKPVQAATEPKPARKKVVRKRETDEQKARRIAAKYGISW
jgi:hypothetical protein